MDRGAVAAAIRTAREGGRTLLSFSEARAVLAACGLSMAEGLLARCPADLAAGAMALGFPLAAKVASPRIAHKSDVGGVITGIRDLPELVRAYEALSAIAAKAGAPLDGVLLQRMISGGLELMAGSHRHPHFGSLVVFGLGGTLVEAMGDVRFGRAPLSAWDAGEMICGIRAASALGTFRGKPPRDFSALEKCLLALSGLMQGFPGIAGIDLNPVMALENGAVIADARILLTETP